MRFFLVDESPDVIHKLTRIIEDNELGIVVGEEKDGKVALSKIKAIVPDIVILNLDIPTIDGLTIVKQVKKEDFDTCFIMISGDVSKDMVERAYRHGVEYYVYKPLSSTEMRIIIEKVIERIQVSRKMLRIQEIFDSENNSEMISPIGFFEQCTKNVLMKIGIIGEKGSSDIIEVCKYLLKNRVDLNNTTLREICSYFTENPKSMEQRMRRSIAAGMANIANLGLEDYMNEVFVEYSNSLFNFEQVRLEMEYIRGKVDKGGSINVKKFLSGLMSYCE
ncbi:MAG TPA: response regulator [Tepidimicrobium sp.]|nr:response regulator [Tepidimicrobium sp.]